MTTYVVNNGSIDATGEYCDVYSDVYGVCPGGIVLIPMAGKGGSYNRPYIGPALTYFGGTSLDAPSVDTPYPYPVALGGHTYVVDLRYYARSSVEPFREASDFNASPGEHSLSNEGAWKRNRSDWSWGAGQTWADDPNSSDQRFHSSKGIDVWTPRQLRLLPDTVLRASSGNANLDLFPVGGYLVMIDGTAIKSTTDPIDNPFVTADCGAAITSATTDGVTVYAAVDATGIFSCAAGATTATAMGGAAGTFNADLVGYANGWLIATADNVVKTVAADGTMATLFTHHNPHFEWVAVISAPNAIYLVGNAGLHNEIYQCAVDQSSGNLQVPVYSGGLPEGETLLAAQFYQGALIFGTTKGLRIAQIDGSGFVEHGPLIPIGPVAALASEGEFVWFSWRNYDTSSTGIGRASLSVFTSPDVPAYASDLMAPAQGQVQGIASFNGGRYFTVVASGLYGPSTSLVQSGTLDTGNLTYSIFDPKALMSIELVTQPLVGSIQLAIVDDIGTQTPIGTRDQHGSTGVGEVFGGHDIVTEQMALQLTLNRDTAPTFGPTVRRLSIRSLPVPSNVEQFTVPIILRETVQAGLGEGEDAHYDVGAEIDFLKNLERSRRPVTYQEGDHSYRVTVRAIQRPQGLDYQWTSDHTAIEGIFEVVVSTLEDS
jgi:hypothetical protein